MCEAGHGWARLGKAGQGGARRGMAGAVHSGLLIGNSGLPGGNTIKAGRGWARHGMARRGRARLGTARRGKARAIHSGKRKCACQCV